MITFLIEDLYYLINDAISISSFLLARFCIFTKIINLLNKITHILFSPTFD
uniref:Uncharacterized protein n=1 Tax=Lepeophtheirus salmonis TaxID=72036 RepID=A0A0K2UK16_LEPSM